MSGRRPPGDDATAPTKQHLDDCRRCDLWRHATQGVPGEGPAHARLMLVGEMPGHEEDVAGRPFVGPAGRLLHELLEEAGLDAARVYITNAVKHFHFVARGKRRIHKTPAQRHVAACRVWLVQEIERVQPAVIVTLGATALAAVHGSRISITAARSQTLTSASGIALVATYHPSAVLRVPDAGSRAELRATLLSDLMKARALLVRR